MELELFDEVAEALRGMVDPTIGELRVRARRWGVKVWFGPAEPPREHYEAQVIGARDVPAAEVVAIEIGFHAEHRDETANEAALGTLVRHQERWRTALGPDAVAGPFLGGAEHWRRLSETWPDPDLSDPDLGMEIAARLADYLDAIEPLR